MLLLLLVLLLLLLLSVLLLSLLLLLLLFSLHLKCAHGYPRDMTPSTSISVRLSCLYEIKSAIMQSITVMITWTKLLKSITEKVHSIISSSTSRMNIQTILYPA